MIICIKLHRIKDLSLRFGKERDIMPEKPGDARNRI